MSNRYYAPGPDHARRVQLLFARIAPCYDLINDLQSFGLHRLWKSDLAKWARVKPGERALDLCCGTGDIAWKIRRAGATVVGIDFSREMLDSAKANLGDGPGLSWTCGDALRLPFSDGSFDLITVGYGLRNLANLERGLAEVRRVLKPAGRLLALDFGKPDNHAWRAIYFGYLRLAVPLLGKMIAGDAAAYGYILDSLRAYPAQAGISAQLGKLGATVELKNYLGGIMSIHRAQF